MKPMLAATLDSLEQVKFPVYVSPKLDGIRCLIHNGVAVSRTLKPIPNKFIQQQLKGLPDGLDGELMIDGDFNEVQSAVMSEDGEPDFLYAVFDVISNESYKNRKLDVEDLHNTGRIVAVKSVLCVDIKQVKELEDMFVTSGYEGIILRNPSSPYKHGRSTLNEGYLLKYKRFKDAEAYIIGFEPLLHNENEKETDNLGYSKRSAAKSGLVPTNALGSLCVYDPVANVEFNIGTGFTHEQRIEIWNQQNKYMGMDVTYKYQDMTSKGVPRFPIFKSFRLAV